MKPAKNRLFHFGAKYSAKSSFRKPVVWRASFILMFGKLLVLLWDSNLWPKFVRINLTSFSFQCVDVNQSWNFSVLTEHPFTDRSALYRIPLELVKNRKLHNEMLFFWVCFWFFQDSTNFKTCLLAAVNFCHWRFRWIFHPSF